MLPSHVISITKDVLSVVLVDGTTVLVVVDTAFSTSCLVVGVTADKIVDDIVVVVNGTVFVISVKPVLEVASDNIGVDNDVIVFMIVVVIVVDDSGQYSLYGQSPISVVTQA